MLQATLEAMDFKYGADESKNTYELLSTVDKLLA